MIRSNLILILLISPLVIYGQQKNCNSNPRRAIPCNAQLTQTINDTTLTILKSGCDYLSYDSSANGIWKVFLSDSTLLEISSLKNGKRNGPSITYFKNGQIKSRSEYKDNLLHGNYVSFYDNGKENGKGIYKTNNRNLELFTGTWKEYWDNGNLAHLYSQKDNSWYDPDESFWNQDGIEITKEHFKKMWDCN